MTIKKVTRKVVRQPDPMGLTRALNVRVTSEVFARLQEAAKLDRRSYSNFVRLVLERELDRLGLQPGQTGADGHVPARKRREPAERALARSA